MLDQESVIQEIVEHWLWHLGENVEPHLIRAALRNAVLSSKEEAWHGWKEILLSTASAVGLREICFRASWNALAQGEQTYPVLIYVPEAMDGNHWIEILEQRRGRYRVCFFHGQTPLWWREEELLAKLRRTRNEAIDIITFEPKTPLSSWKSETPDIAAFDTGVVWSRLRGLLLSERKDLWIIVIYAVVIGIFSLTTPVAVQLLVNTVAFGTLLQPLVVLSFMLAAGLIFLACMQFMQIYLTEMINRRVFVRVVDDFSYRFPRLKMSVFGKYNRSEIANYFFEVLTIQKVSSSLLFDGLTGVLTIGSGLLLLAAYHPILLAFDMFLIIAILLLVYFFGRGAIKSGIKKSKAKHKVAVWLDQLLHQPIMFRSYGGYEYAQVQAELLTRQYVKTRQQHFSIVLRQIVAGLGVQVLASTALLLVGGWLVIKQQLTLGQLVAAELIVSVVVGALFKLVKSFEKFYELMASLDKIGKVVDLELEHQDGVLLAPSHEPASLQFSNVSHFSLAGQKLFDNMTWEVSPGTVLGIVGYNDAGKKALADILFGLQKPKQGFVLINGRAIRDTNLVDLRRSVALVRDIEFVEASILDNLRLERPEVGRVEARNALERVGLLQEVSQLPDGIQTMLDAEGAPLSQRQMRLLMLARAIAGKPNLLVVDGLLDTFDSDVIEFLKQSVFSAPNARCTVVVFTERDDVILCCDQVYKMDKVVRHLPQTSSLSKATDV